MIFVTCPHYLFFRLTFFSKTGIIVNRGSEMAARVKPVQPTEIREEK